MPFIIALGILVTVYAYYTRARAISNVLGDLFMFAGDARLAARRFGFRCRANTHPVDATEDADALIAAIAAAFVELEALPTQDMQDRVIVAIARQLGISGDDAQELAVHGRWLVGQCNTPQAAITRLARKLFRDHGNAASTPLLNIIQTTLAPTGTALNQSQKDALCYLRRVLNLG